MGIPGIDVDLVKGLLKFKAVATRSFVFDPVTGIPGMDRKALASRQEERRERLKKELQTGAVRLVELRHEILARREELSRELDEVHGELAHLMAEAGMA